MKSHKIPMIPAYGVWSIPQPGERNTVENHMKKEKSNAIGDIRGRHVIRSENFLDVLSELAQVNLKFSVENEHLCLQVKLKEDITDDFSQAATFIEFMTDNIRKL